MLCFPSIRTLVAAGCGLALCFALASYAGAEPPAPPKGLGAITYPENNPHTAEKVELGKQLYFDKRLSRDNTVSCATCHDPDKGWSNGDTFATGVRGQRGGRSSPSIVNSAYSTLQFWDGRATHLEGQALGPIQNPIEMDMTIDEVVAKLNKIAGYREQCQKIFQTDVTPDAIARSIAAFERTILSGDAPYDRFKAGDTKAMSEQAQRGAKLFFGKANCSACHTGHSFSDFAFHNLGIGMDKDMPDLGRFVVTKIEGDKGAFKTPTLREISRTAPYMHDGRFKTLDEVVDYYDKGGHPNAQLDEEIFELKLTKQEQADLVKFLVEGLTSESYPHVKPPKLPE
ncbi:Cytochrome c551 peroxidase precursor [Anatilimnocola aggregata]|uniref:Methylamine utilization protein MauG n=1 Tax=Anatilimnocola aggregata TaxID=2528021 RepID=A0A517Y643_9BACT|nr:cytochrome c peroxidase [Anatilimnocola aggregata]QDU25703.1 Cytochrome c551 peroxidase precursor [Anatilimnocola aggregata]